MKTTYRKATQEDALSLAKIIVKTSTEIYKETFPEDKFDDSKEHVDRYAMLLRNRIRHNFDYILCEVDNNIVGCIDYELIINGPYKGFGTIKDFYILKEYQKKKIGTKLFNMACQELKDKGATKLYVETVKGTQSVFFYQKMGGKVFNIKNFELYNLVVKAYEIIFDI